MSIARASAMDATTVRVMNSVTSLTSVGATEVCVNNDVMKLKVFVLEL